MQHDPREVVGFWMMFCGGVPWFFLALHGIVSHKKVERDFYNFPQLSRKWVMVGIFLLIAGTISLIGLGMMSVGNHGRYPSYPFDVILQWMADES